MPSPIRVFAVVRSISPPFNRGQLVEIKLATEDGAVVDGELYVRVSPARAQQYAIGDEFVLRLDRV